MKIFYLAGFLRAVLGKIDVYVADFLVNLKKKNKKNFEGFKARFQLVSCVRCRNDQLPKICCNPDQHSKWTGL